MKLHRQQFLLSYLKTLSVGTAGVGAKSRPPAWQPGAQPTEPPYRRGLYGFYRDFTIYDAVVNENATKQQYHWLKEEK